MGYNLNFASQIAQIAAPDLVGSFTEGYATRKKIQEIKAAELLAAQQVQAQAKLSDLVKLSTDNTGKTNFGAVRYGMAQAGLGHMVPELFKQHLDFDKTGAEIGKITAEGGNLNASAASTTQKTVDSQRGSALNMMTAAGSHEQAGQMLAAYARNGILAPEEAQTLFDWLPKDPTDPDYVAKMDRFRQASRTVAAGGLEQFKAQTQLRQEKMGNDTQIQTTQMNNDTSIKTTGMNNATQIQTTGMNNQTQIQTTGMNNASAANVAGINANASMSNAQTAANASMTNNQLDNQTQRIGQQIDLTKARETAAADKTQIVDNGNGTVLLVNKRTGMAEVVKTADGQAVAGKVTRGANASLPVAALKMVTEGQDNIHNLSEANKSATRILQLLNTGKLDLSPASNLQSIARNAAGLSNTQSQAYAEAKASVQKFVNDSLLLNKGVQTEGDAQRAAQAIIANMNDTNVVRVQMARLVEINNRGIQAQRRNIQTVQANYGRVATPQTGTVVAQIPTTINRTDAQAMAKQYGVPLNKVISDLKAKGFTVQ